MADKYNYATALELLKDAYNANVKVTYIDLENALGLEHPIDDKKYIRISLGKSFAHNFSKFKNDMNS